MPSSRAWPDPPSPAISPSPISGQTNPRIRETARPTSDSPARSQAIASTSARATTSWSPPSRTPSRRSPSRARFAPAGAEADEGWVSDLVECLEHATACGGTLPEPAAGYARRFLFLLDGLAVHVLADHIGPKEAFGFAMTALRSDIRGLA
jgi:hypothetical protein